MRTNIQRQYIPETDSPCDKRVGCLSTKVDLGRTTVCVEEWDCGCRAVSEDHDTEGLLNASTRMCEPVPDSLLRDVGEDCWKRLQTLPYGHAVTVVEVIQERMNQWAAHVSIPVSYHQ